MVKISSAASENLIGKAVVLGLHLGPLAFGASGRSTELWLSLEGMKPEDHKPGNVARMLCGGSSRYFAQIRNRLEGDSLCYWEFYFLLIRRQQKAKFELVSHRQTIEAPFLLRHDVLVKGKPLLTHADIYDSVPRPMIIFSRAQTTPRPRPYGKFSWYPHHLFHESA
jgi:hypothetical protein